jgi:cytochrome c biogenesis protein CcdA
MRNIGSADRILRLVVGLILVFVGLSALLGGPFAGLGATWRWLALIVGVVMIGTAIIRFCPAYTLFGWNTDRHG